MRMVDAYWEQANLNRSVTEAQIEMSDTFESIAEALISDTSDQIVVSLPTRRADMLAPLQSMGLALSDVICTVRGKTPFLQTPAGQGTLGFDLSVENGADLDTILAEIHRGVFSVDRTSLDPHLGPSFSRQRFSNWLRQEIDSGAMLCWATLKGSPFGWFTLKWSPGGQATSILSATLAERRFPSSGYLLISCLLQHSEKMGAVSYETRISLNNFSVLRTHLDLGLTLTQGYYVLSLHRSSGPASKG